MKSRALLSPIEAFFAQPCCLMGDADRSAEFFEKLLRKIGDAAGKGRNEAAE